jgi:hypothetical protein
MKRLLFVSVMALFLLGSWSPSVSGLDKPFVIPENTDNPSTDGDHPWGGDNNTPDTTPPAGRPALISTPVTGIGAIDMILRVFSYRYVASVAHLKAGRASTIPKSTVTTTTTTTTSTATSTTGIQTTDNQ